MSRGHSLNWCWGGARGSVTLKKRIRPYSLVHFSILLILLAMRILLRTYRELKLNCGSKRRLTMRKSEKVMVERQEENRVNMAGACMIAYKKKQPFGHLRDVVTNRVIAYL